MNRAGGQDNQVLKLFYEWCPEEWQRREIETGRRLAVTSLARRLAELHSDIHAQNGAGYGSLRASLQAGIRDSEGLPAETRQEVLQRLERLPDGTALCHFDFHPDQVLMTGRGPMIIDWMTALQGPPLADVARTFMLLTFGEALDTGWLLQRLINLLRKAFRGSYLRRYLQLHPEASRAELRAWMLPVAAARLQERLPGEEGPLREFIRDLLQEDSAPRAERPP